MDLTEFAAAVGGEGPVTISGLGTRGGPVAGVRCVHAPAGIEWVQADEMIVSCGAGTRVDELVAALAAHHQTVALPAGGTVGGALSVGHGDVRRLGYGPVRDVLLQARYVSAAGELVMFDRSWYNRAGGWPDREERERFRSLPVAGGLSWNARLPGRCHPAHSTVAAGLAVVHLFGR